MRKPLESRLMGHRDDAARRSGRLLARAKWTKAGLEQKVHLMFRHHQQRGIARGLDAALILVRAEREDG
jgi:hypothetical protein